MSAGVETGSRPRRTARAWIAAGIGASLLLVAAVVAGVAWARSYAPLEWSSTIAPDVDSPLFYRSVSPPFGDGDTVYVLRFRPHHRFRFGFDVRNTGRFAVRLDGIVKSPEDWGGAIRIADAAFQPNRRRYMLDGATPMPVTLEPREERFLIVSVETGEQCPLESGSVEGFGSVDLRYSYLGVFHRTQTLELPLSVGITCGDPEMLLRMASR